MKTRITKKERRVLKQQGVDLDQVTFNNTLKEIKPLTIAQSKTFKAFDNDKHIILHGLAGTGKSYISLYLALKEVLSGTTDYEKVVLVRSVVPTREMGFLPGSIKEKIKVYEAPYEKICSNLFSRGDSYSILKSKNYVEFTSTSFIRGLTYDNCIIVVDEIQNMTFHELDSVITRVGENCKIIFCGDYRQTDLQRNNEKHGLLDFMQILRKMDMFEYIEFGEQDIVRSKFVKEYIIQKARFGIS
jgi:phosphate starvation-inducible PhoH-like protein